MQLATTYVIPALSADTAWEQLLSRGARLVVEAVFSRTINLRAQTADGRLYSIFLRDGFSAPHGLSVDSFGAPVLVRQGDVVEVSGRAVHLPRLTISTKGCTFQSCAIEAGAPSPGVVQALEERARQRYVTDGFVLDASNGEIGQAMKRQLDERRLSYLNCIGADDEYLARAVRSLIGLGPGLTPAGDDYLVGQLAVAWQTSQLEQVARVIASTFRSHGTRTTPVGRHYLEQALEGKFSQPVRDVCDGVLSGDAEQVTTAVDALVVYGSSSGRDCLLGLLDGYRVLNNKENA